MGALMALAVFGVEEPLIADLALVRPLIAVQVDLLMTTDNSALARGDLASVLT